MPADFKQGPRIVDRDAARRARLQGDECAACGRPPANVHHVVQKGAPYFGDDVPGNLVLICGSGTMGCHGAWHGTPYTTHVARGRVERRDADWVGRRIGEYLVQRRPDVIEYVLGKLGDQAGREYLRRHYHLDLPAVRAS